MARLQLAINVHDLEAGISFYEKFFDTPVTKRRPGYANFEIADPPLKLVLFHQPEQAGSLNHLGVEMDSTDGVQATQQRLVQAGLTPGEASEETCCYAAQTKFWVDTPDQQAWEVYTVLGDASPEITQETAKGESCCVQS